MQLAGANLIRYCSEVSYHSLLESVTQKTGEYQRTPDRYGSMFPFHSLDNTQVWSISPCLPSHLRTYIYVECTSLLQPSVALLASERKLVHPLSQHERRIMGTVAYLMLLCYPVLIWQIGYFLHRPIRIYPRYQTKS